MNGHPVNLPYQAFATGPASKLVGLAVLMHGPIDLQKLGEGN